MGIFSILSKKRNLHTTNVNTQVFSFLFNFYLKAIPYQLFNSKTSYSRYILKPIKLSLAAADDNCKQYSCARNRHKSECL